MELDIIKNSTTWNDAAGSINNNFEKLRLSVEEGGGSSVTVDTEVSSTSTNPIANKSIKKYVDDEMVRMEGYAEDVANDAEALAKKYADDNKVAKVDGKQLSTEDFTTTLKQKLEGLTNYDDTEVKSAIEALESNLDAILNGNASGAIENINEILAFLSTIADTDTLAGIVANLQGLIAANTTEIEALEESVDAELAKRPEPLIIEVGIDFPSETATGTIADFAVSYETVKAAMESGSNIEMVEANGNRHSCTFFCDNGENGIVVRATTHTTNESHIRMLVFARGSSVVVWRSNYHILQEQLVSGVNIKTVNGESLLGSGDITIEGGGISEETEVYIGEEEPTDEGAKLWVDTDDESGETGGGGSSSGESAGGGLETRILYVPEVTAGSELTDEEKAYNAETCQKLMAGTAIAFLTQDFTSAYSDNIVDLTPLGESGYAVHFGAIGGVILMEGDVFLTTPDIEGSVIIPHDVTSYDSLSLMLALAVFMNERIPTFYYTSDADELLLVSRVATNIGDGIALSVRFDGTVEGTGAKILMECVLTPNANIVVKYVYPDKLRLATTANEVNAMWMDSRFTAFRAIPTLIYGSEAEYVPISIEDYTNDTGYADFVIYRNGAFETWRMLDDGSSTLITE